MTAHQTKMNEQLMKQWKIEAAGCELHDTKINVCYWSF